MDLIRPTQKNWYVIYTRSRAEKKVLAELQTKGISCFLPLQKKLRQWKDRKKWVETPLIAGYCFVNISRIDYDTVLQTNNVVCYITFEGKAVTIPDEQIHALQKLIQQYDFDVSVSSENFEAGKKVEIVEGPLVGLQGELIDCRGKNRFILRIQQIDTIFTVEVPASIISAIPQ